MKVSHAFRYVGGKQYRVLVVGDDSYIDTAVLDDIAESRVRDMDAGFKFYEKVEELLGEGNTITDMTKDDFPGVKLGTYNYMMGNIRRLAKNKEGYGNTKRTLKNVYDAGCHMLLEVIL